MICLAGKTNIQYVILAVKEGPGSPELPKSRLELRKQFALFAG